MQVDGIPEVSSFLQHVDKLPAELVAELGVVAAATPLPVQAIGPRVRGRVARAGGHTAV